VGRSGGSTSTDGVPAMTETLRVLHLDGDADYLERMSDRLEATAGDIEVVTETGVRGALERIERGSVDCLLTEAAPPGTEPLELVEYVSDAVPELPVVVVDDGPANGGPTRILEAGADELMQKTTETEALRLLSDRVRSVASAGATDPAARTPAQEADGGVAGTETTARAERVNGGLLDEAPVGAWVVRGGTVVYANRACAELFGREPEAIVGRPVGSLVQEADSDVLAAHREALLAEDVAERTDVVTGVGRWGERRRLELQGQLTETEEGRAVLDIVRDVTDDRMTQRRLSTLFRGLDDPVAEVAIEDGRAVVEAVNAAFELAFGVDETSLVDEPLAPHVVPDDEALEAAIEVYVRAERGARVVEEVTRMTDDGERPFRLQALPFEAGGDTRAYIVYSELGEASGRERDLTELQAVARELMAADDYEEMARVGVGAAERVLDTELACLFVLDDSEEALVPEAATEAARELFGEVPTIGPGEGAAWYVHEMGDPLVTDDVRSIDTVANRETAVRSEILVPVEGHGVFVASATEEGVFDETDEALARTLASTLEAALNRAGKDELLRERERELVRENERLEEFAGIVSHDLRSPLAVVKGNANLLREDGDPKYLDRIEAAADRMDDLIDDLLSLARQGAMVDEPEFVDLAETVTRSWATTETGDATLAADVELTLEADPSRLQQLLENLFRNAVEHGGEAVTVRVGVIEADADERAGGQYGRDVVGFYVEDTGSGLPEDADDLFEPGTTTVEDGTGFGLAVVSRIAEAHGWELTATEGSDGGARFEFTGVEGV